MKIAIVKKDLTIESWYDAATPQQETYGGDLGRPEYCVHIALEAGDFRAASAVLIPAVEGQLEKWTKEGEEDLFNNPVDESWTHVPEIGAVPEHIELQVDSGLAATLAAADQAAAIQAAVAAARAFGTQLGDEFAAGNLALGITNEQADSVLGKMAGVLIALQSGSLNVAIARAKDVNPADYDGTFLTAARLLVFINKIETYLGITLTVSL
jgi:hypothetical protein